MLKRLFGSESANEESLDSFEPPKASIIKRCFRFAKWAIAVGAAAFLITWIKGIPYVRWDEPLLNAKDGTLDERHRSSARYVTIGQSRIVYANEYGQGLPLVVFVKEDKSERINVSDGVTQ
jgi:hypothetical protein